MKSIVILNTLHCGEAYRIECTGAESCHNIGLSLLDSTRKCTAKYGLFLVQSRQLRQFIPAMSNGV